MDSWISDIESLFTDGTTDIDFPMERWAALSAENSLKTDLAHRTAEMAGIGGTTDVNGQPGMMLGADAVGGNAVMYPQGFGYGPGDLDGTGAYLLPGMSSQASPLHDAGINGATMYGSSAIITSSGKSVAGQVTSTSATQVEKPKKKKKKNKVFGFLKDAADFLILDDVKTVFDPKASLWDKGVAIFSVTPTGKAVKAGRLGFKLVRNSPFGKGIVKKVDQVTGKGTSRAETSRINKIDDRPKQTQLENGPYIKNGKPNGRPTLSGNKKVQFEKDVYKNQVDLDGTLRDPNTGTVIDWKPGQPRKDVVDFGHTKGNTYKSMFEKYKKREITLEDLKEFQFDSKNYRLETPSSNRSHKFE